MNRADLQVDFLSSPLLVLSRNLSAQANGHKGHPRL